MLSHEHFVEWKGSMDVKVSSWIINLIKCIYSKESKKNRLSVAIKTTDPFYDEGWE